MTIQGEGANERTEFFYMVHRVRRLEAFHCDRRHVHHSVYRNSVHLCVICHYHTCLVKSYHLQSTNVNGTRNEDD